MGLSVGPHAYARGAGELGHLCDVAIKGVEIDKQRRGLNLGDGYTNLGGRRVHPFAKRAFDATIFNGQLACLRRGVNGIMNAIPRIRVAEVHKRFGSLEVLRGVSFDVHRGNVVSVIGASGSGKSTLLRCVNYLERPNAGEVYLEGTPLGSRLDADGRRKPRSLAEINKMRCELGVVFQQFNLWPHMTVLGNVIEAPIRVRKLSRAEATALAHDCLRRVRL